MGGAIEMYRRSVEEFGQRVMAIGPDDWQRSTPCPDWTVRDLLRHLVYEERWAPPLLAGATIADIGDRFEGDILGDDPQVAWKEAAAAAMAAGSPEVLDRTVHLSFGDFPGREYLGQLTADHVIHAWDLARGIGGDDRLDPELVQFVYDFMLPQADQWAAAGVFAPPVDVPADTDVQSKLLALTGRRP
ncbi:MAG: TIGR03086 family protein [Actinobacteria bacterium]|nr:TIGR03086 family protein [Actinomycetota bacterium]